MISKRAYLTIAELEEFADITVTDPVEAYDKISQAEELIDSWVGFQVRAMRNPVSGEVSSVINDVIIVDSGNSTPLNVTDGSYTGCIIEIVGGTGAGQSARINASSKDGQSVTIDNAFTTPPNTDSVYTIRQIAKFPRSRDITTNRNGSIIYKTVPEAVRRATAAQVAYMIEMGPEYFTGDDSEMVSESLGNYSYNRSGNIAQSSLVKMLGPRARAYLRGITNRGGRIVPENPTCQ